MGENKRPRDSQLSKVWRAVTGCSGPCLATTPELPTACRTLFAGAVASAAVRRLLGAAPAAPPVRFGRSSRGGADGVCLEKGVAYFSFSRLLALLAEHLAVKHHPPDEPLHGWRYARLLLALTESAAARVKWVGLDTLPAALRQWFRYYKVKYRAPRQSVPASPEQIERLRGLRTLNALDRLFGEAASPPGGHP